MKDKNKKTRLGLIGLFCILVVFVAGWILLVQFEGEKPTIMLEQKSLFIKDSKELSIEVADQKSGIRKISIGLLKNNKEIKIFEKNFPAAGFFKGGEIHASSLKIKIKMDELGITDGKGVLRLAAWDYSWRKLWKGNKTYLEKAITIDTNPPEIDILSRIHNIIQGGAGLVIYRISEPCLESGIQVGKNYFPGYSGYFKDDKILLSFFALDYNQGTDTELFLKATDNAGNTSKAGLNHYIKKKTFKNDIINISDRFLKLKIPEFETKIPGDANQSLLDKFLMINNKIRQADFNSIKEIGEKTDPVLYWQGVFLRLPRSAQKAGFADRRTYKHNGRIIDRQVHLGIDLASVARSRVPASNNGKIVFSGSLGIYGKTVMIDHGFGLFSMYSHLSSINVQPEQMVSKGEIIGRTGSTGLAGGDHLHFGMFIHNTFVNPVEWWDNQWIKNNISYKIKYVESSLNQE